MLRFFNGNFNGFRLDIENDSDGLRIEGHNSTIENFSIINTFDGFRDHNDLIQVVPYAVFSNYCGPYLDSLTIRNGFLRAKGKVHGITCFDALLKKVEILDCYILTKSSHTITLCGLVEGKFENLKLVELNDDKDPTPGTLKLYPLRLGGGDNINEIKVMSFKDFKYKEVEKDDSFKLEDHRFEYTSNFNCSYVENFDIVSFHKEVSKKTNPGLSLSDGSLLEIVKCFGDVV